MPAIIEDDMSDATESGATALPFPPITKAHIMNCSYHSWHPKYRTVTPKARLIPLSQPFLDYLRADGIILPDDDEPSAEPEWSDDSGVFSSSEARGQDAGDEEEQGDVAAGWRDIHTAVQDTISTLGGRVMPKLNWSSPKDATWMNANSMDCRTPNDVYLLLKSSDFVTHDLEHAFDDTVPGEGPEANLTNETIPYHLVLRKAFEMNPSVEFRCFVRNRKLIGICQRDLNHFDFLFELRDRLQSKIQEFFDVRLRDTFPDENFVFDIYVPTPYERCWLVDVNPWAPRTDPLLFSWLELLTMDEPPEQPQEEEQTVRIPIRFGNANGEASGDVGARLDALDIKSSEAGDTKSNETDESDSESDVDEEIWKPEFRLIRKSDPEAYSFSTPQYSAHKMPKDVVDAGASGEGLREFARDWREILEKRQRQDAEGDSSGDE